MKGSLKQIAIFAALFGIGGGVGALSSRYWLPSSPPATAELTPVEPSPLENPNAIPIPQISSSDRERNFIAQAVQKVGPAVVRIDAARVLSRNESNPRQQPFFRRFFGDDSSSSRQRRIEQGTGSGFILEGDGRLLTNAHVVDGANEVRVTLRDGRTFEGTVIGSDPVTDVAAIKIEADDAFPKVALGSSEDLVPGEWAIAIGNPLGLNNTVTVGIISGLDRSSSEVGVRDKRVRFIQTDAAINPGNSGGPLLNADGEVVGINTAIRADAQGLGFAIPIETAIRIANQLFARGEADHPYLGIQMVTLDPDMREQLQRDRDYNFDLNPDEAGVLIVRVVEGSPAESAGFQDGDIILSVGGQAIATAAEVQEEVEKSEIGVPLTVKVRRQGRTTTLQVRPGAFPTDRSALRN